jgi:hypothetical protein
MRFHGETRVEQGQHQLLASEALLFWQAAGREIEGTVRHVVGLSFDETYSPYAAHVAERIWLNMSRMLWVSHNTSSRIFYNLFNPIWLLGRCIHAASAADRNLPRATKAT